MSYAALANLTNTLTSSTTTLKPITYTSTTQLNALPRDILQWLQTLDLSYSIQTPVHNEFSNGYLIGEILCYYYTSDTTMLLNAFQNGHSSAAKKNNWNYLTTFWERHSHIDLGNNNNDNTDVNVNSINWQSILNNKTLLTGVQYNEPGAAVELLVQLYKLLTGKSIKSYTTQWQSTAKKYSTSQHTNTLIQQHQSVPQPYMRPTVSLLIKSRMSASDMQQLRDNPTIESRVSERIVNDYINVKQYDKQLNPTRYTYVPNTTKYDLGPPKSFNARNTGRLSTTLSKTQTLNGTLSRSQTLSKTALKPTTSNGVAQQNGISDHTAEQTVEVIPTQLPQTAVTILSTIIHNKLTLLTPSDNVFDTLLTSLTVYSEIDLASTIQSTTNDNETLQRVAQQCIDDTAQYNQLFGSLYTLIGNSKQYTVLYNELIALIHTLVSAISKISVDAAYALLQQHSMNKLLQIASTIDVTTIKLAYSYVPDTAETHYAVLQQLNQQCNNNIPLLASIAIQLFPLESTIDQSLFSWYDNVATTATTSPDVSIRVVGIQLIRTYGSSTDINMLGYVSNALNNTYCIVSQLHELDCIEWCSVAVILLLNTNAANTYPIAIQILQQLLLSQSQYVLTTVLCVTSVLLGTQPIIRSQWLNIIETQPLIRDTVLASNSILHATWEPLTVLQCLAEYTQQQQCENLHESYILVVCTAINDAVFTQESINDWSHVITVLRDYLIVELCDLQLCHIITDVFIRLLTDTILQTTMIPIVFNTLNTVTQCSLFGIMRYIYPDADIECQNVFAKFIQTLLQNTQSELLHNNVVNLLQQFKQHEPQKYQNSPLNNILLR